MSHPESPESGSAGAAIHPAYISTAASARNDTKK